MSCRLRSFIDAVPRQEGTALAYCFDTSRRETRQYVLLAGSLGLPGTAHGACAIALQGTVLFAGLPARKTGFTALDGGPGHVDFVREFGNRVLYGDASRLDLLRAAGTGNSRALVPGMNDIASSLKTAAHAAVARLHRHDEELLRYQQEDYPGESRFIQSAMQATEALQALFDQDAREEKKEAKRSD